MMIERGNMDPLAGRPQLKLYCSQNDLHDYSVREEGQNNRWRAKTGSCIRHSLTYLNDFEKTRRMYRSSRECLVDSGYCWRADVDV